MRDKRAGFAYQGRSSCASGRCCYARQASVSAKETVELEAHYGKVDPAFRLRLLLELRGRLDAEFKLCRSSDQSTDECIKTVIRLHALLAVCRRNVQPGRSLCEPLHDALPQCDGAALVAVANTGGGWPQAQPANRGIGIGLAYEARRAGAVDGLAKCRLVVSQDARCTHRGVS